MHGVKSIKEYQGEEINWTMFMNVSSLKAELSKNACFVPWGRNVFVPGGKKYLIYVRAIYVYYMFVP